MKKLTIIVMVLLMAVFGIVAQEEEDPIPPVPTPGEDPIPLVDGETIIDTITFADQSTSYLLSGERGDSISISVVALDWALLPRLLLHSADGELLIDTDGSEYVRGLGFILIDNYVLPDSGIYHMEVISTSGEGKYSLSFVIKTIEDVELVSDLYLQDASLITEQPCGPPCWRGITPGETIWNEAIAIIDDDETLVDLQTRSDDATGQIGAAWAQAGGRNCCQMFSQDGETVSLLVTQTVPAFTLGVVLEKFGEPQYVIGEVVTDGQALISVYYPNKNMLIYVFVAGEDGIISENNEVIGFAYTSTDVMELIIQTSDLYAWRGTGQTLSAYLDSYFDVTPSITLTPVYGN